MSNKKNRTIADEPEFVEEQGESAEHADSASPEDMRILEALLFASDEVLTASKLKSIVPGQPDLRKIRSMVNDINIRLQKERHPFEIVELGGGFQFRTITFYQPWVRQLFKEGAPKKLSMQGLECLAIIAYKQPITKAEIEAIRGVVSDGAMKTLLERRMVTIVGRSEKAGRPLLYGTTPDFLHYFGIKQLSDLPRIEEFEALAKEKMEELSEQELEMINSLEDSDAEQTQQEDNQGINDNQGAHAEASAESAPKEVQEQPDEAAPHGGLGEHVSAQSPVNAEHEQAPDSQSEQESPQKDSSEQKPHGAGESPEIDSDESAGAEQDSHEKS